MFRKLRIQFILIATGAVACIVLFFASLINIVNYIQTNSQMEIVLRVLSQNGGVLPEDNNFLPQSTQTEIDRIIYFTRVIDENNQIEQIASSQSGITTNKQETLLKRINTSQEKVTYFYDDGKTYGYEITATTGNKKLLVVLDVTNYIQQRTSLLAVTIQMSVVSLLLFFVIAYILSKKAIQPFVDNYDKQKRFIANAGHELKTPLSIILANTELQELMTGENEWTTSTKDQAKRLTNLINQMVSLASLEEQPDIVVSEVDFSAITQDAAEDFKGPIIRQGKQFNLSIQSGITVKAEEKSLFELVTILVDNANKYCDANGQVNVSLKSINNLRHKARLDVTNTYADGEHIDYTRFFDRFYREDESRNSKGFGIGLSMAQSFVTLFKGKIFATYKDGKITFTVLL